VVIHQDVNLYRASLRDGAKLELPLRAGRHAWVQVARGVASVNGINVSAGDGLAVSVESNLLLLGRLDAELLVFDLP
ncbi:MAG: pirin family protein, partial [Gammaproteobacteria bacterium]